MYTKKMDEWLEGQRENMLADLAALVRIDSQRGEPAEGKPFGEGPARVLDAAKELMDRYGLKTTDYDHYVVTGDFGEGEKVLDILAHLDVVPVTDDWTVTKPFEPLITEGRIYGRGTADDKGPAIAALYAIRAVRELGIPISKSVRLILGSDEECGSSDLKHYYGLEKEALYTFTPDADFPLINLEKARLAKRFSAPADNEGGVRIVKELKAGSKVNVVPGSASALVSGLSLEDISACAGKAAEKLAVTVTCRQEGEDVRIDVKGTSAHGSTPELGQNAATALLTVLCSLPLDETRCTRALRAVASLYPHGDTCGETLGVKMEDEVSGALSMNLGILNLADGRLCGEFDSRAPLCATDANLTAVMREKFAENGIEMEGGLMTPGHYVPADSTLVQTLLGSYEKYFGVKGEALSTGGGTYVHSLERGVAFGCMVEEVDNHMHGDDEFMEIDMLVKSAKIFADAIVKLCR